RFISNAKNADFAQVVTTVDREKRGRGTTMFLVDMDTPGVRIVRAEPTMMDDEPCEIAFDNVRVPAANMVGGEGEGFKFAQDWINVGRIRHGARALGVIERCLELGTSYAKQRVTFGRPLADRQAVQWMLADSYIEQRMLRLAVYNA